MTSQRSTEFIRTLTILGVLALGVLGLQSLRILLQGNVCNYTSTDVWVTVSESGTQKVHPLAPGQCTQGLRQDAEAIWGKDCRETPCRHQAWKVSAGRFSVLKSEASLSGTVLRIDGWGVGSRWHISDEWTKPDLSIMDYSLVE